MSKKTIVMFIIVLICVFMIILLLKNSNDKVVLSTYESIIDRVDNKETFNLLLQNNDNDDIIEIFDYYHDVYDIDYKLLLVDYNDERFNELLEKLSLDILPQDKSVFIVVEDGKVRFTIRGEYSEFNLKKFLVDHELIEKRYMYIDAIIYGNFQDYYKDNNSYCVLYIRPDNQNIYDYRKTLVRNDIRSIIMYPNYAGSEEAEKYFKEKIDFGNNINEKLPAIIKIKQKKILGSHTNVSIKDITRLCN